MNSCYDVSNRIRRIGFLEGTELFLQILQLLAIAFVYYHEVPLPFFGRPLGKKEQLSSFSMASLASAHNECLILLNP